jgi:hypothetical protein
MPYTIRRNPKSNTYKVTVTKTGQVVANATTKPAEVIKAIGSMSDINYQPAIDKTAYSLAASVANAFLLEETNGASSINSGSFYVGLDLENYTNAPKDTIFAGYNSNTDDIYAIMNFVAPVAVGACRFDAFAMFDEVIVFENNTAFVRF